MTARPTHAQQQQDVTDALEALPSQKWRWLFTPDPRWLAAVNTTTLREVNAVRMFVLVTLLWNGLGLAVTAFALGRCHLFLGAVATGETVAAVRRACEESHATLRMLDFTSALFNSYGILLGAMAGIAVGAMWAKRATDTEHRVRVEEAKKAPIIVPPGPVTAEHQAQSPVNQTVNVGEDAIAASQTRVQGEAEPEDVEHEWRDSEPKAGLG